MDQPLANQDYSRATSSLAKDSSEVESDMSPNAIQTRLRTLGQLSKLSGYLAQGKIVGQVIDRRQDGAANGIGEQSK